MLNLSNRRASVLSRWSAAIGPGLNDLVRLCDGRHNPIGVWFSCQTRRALLEAVDEMFLHYFPARAMPALLPRSLAGVLDSDVGRRLSASVHRPGESEPEQVVAVLTYDLRSVARNDCVSSPLRLNHRSR